MKSVLEIHIDEDDLNDMGFDSVEEFIAAGVRAVCAVEFLPEELVTIYPLHIGNRSMADIEEGEVIDLATYKDRSKQ